MKSAESSWERWVPDSSESSWTLYGTVWVKLSDFRDSVESSSALFGTELSQAEHCIGQFESSLAFSGTVLSQAQRCPWLLSILWIVLSYIFLFNYFNFKGTIVCKEFFCGAYSSEHCEYLCEYAKDFAKSFLCLKRWNLIMNKIEKSRCTISSINRQGFKRIFSKSVYMYCRRKLQIWTKPLVHDKFLGHHGPVSRFQPQKIPKLSTFTACILSSFFKDCPVCGGIQAADANEMALVVTNLEGWLNNVHFWLPNCRWGHLLSSPLLPPPLP